MANWSNMKTRITASVRTTSRMNALLSESLINKRKAQLKHLEAESDASLEHEHPHRDLKFIRTNFNMEQVYKLIGVTIEERLTWDRFSRSYDSWRSLQLAEHLAADIRDRVKKLHYKRHRIVCILSVIEKQNQGVSFRMCHLLDEKNDNFTNFVYERPTYFIVATLFMVFKD